MRNLQLTRQNSFEGSEQQNIYYDTFTSTLNDYFTFCQNVAAGGASAVGAANTLLGFLGTLPVVSTFLSPISFVTGELEGIWVKEQAVNFGKFANNQLTFVNRIREIAKSIIKYNEAEIDSCSLEPIGISERLKKIFTGDISSVEDLAKFHAALVISAGNKGNLKNRDNDLIKKAFDIVNMSFNHSGHRNTESDELKDDFDYGSLLSRSDNVEITDNDLVGIENPALKHIDLLSDIDITVKEQFIYFCATHDSPETLEALLSEAEVPLSGTTIELILYNCGIHEA